MRITVILGLLIYLAGQAFAQDITITGKVVDPESQEGIPGAAIAVKGEARGTATDFEGNFTLSDVTPQTTLVVSAIGYQSYEFQPGEKREFNISLQAEVEQLEEVIVTGYGNIRKSDLTGSISSVEAKEITSLPVATVSEAMQGRAAGVQITQNSGAPGASATIRIRGIGTVNNSDPLFVVDGIIVNDIDYLNNDDIANIEVLKDASVTALYGARAANGVVVITTKKGAAGDIKINFGTQLGFQNYWKTLDMMDAYEYKVMQALPLGGEIVRNVVQRLEDGSLQITADNDWLDLISRTGNTQKYNLSFSGGTKNLNYYLGASRFTNNGIIKNTGFVRDNINADIGFNVTDRIRLRSKTIFSLADQQETPNSGGRYTIIRRALSEAPDLRVQDSLGVIFDTPVSQINFDKNTNSTQTLQNNFYLDIDITNNLSFTSRAGIINTWSDQFIFNQKDPLDEITFNQDATTFIRQSETRTLKWSWENLLNYDLEVNDHSISSTFAYSLEAFNFSNITAQNRSFLGNDLDVASLGSGFRADQADGSEARWTNVGFVARVNYSYLRKYLVQFNFRADGSSRFQNDRWGYLPGVSLGWVMSEESFIKDLNIKWLDFLKLRGSWGQSGNNRISSGNQVQENYRSYTLLSQGFPYGYGDESRYRVYDGFAPLGQANELITWERTATYNVGLDFTLFEGRLDNSVEVYQRDTRGMLLDVPTVPSIGFDLPPTRNGGRVRNRGLDFNSTFKTDIKKLHLEIGGNASLVRNTVLELGDNNQPVFGGLVNYDGLARGPLHNFVTITEVGRPIGSFYGYVIEGIFQNQEEIAEAGLEGQANPGDFKFADLNQDGVINPEDRTILGTPFPDVTYGVTLSAFWNNFDVRIFIQGESGKATYNTLNYNLLGYNGSNALAGMNQRFWNDGYFEDLEPSPLVNQLQQRYPPNTNTNIPRATQVDPQWGNYNRPSTFFVENSDYVRIKNFQLGYSLPKKWIEKYSLSSVRIFSSIQNLFTWTKYGGLDPEIGPGSQGSNLANGIDFGQYPQARTITFGINANFN